MLVAKDFIFVHVPKTAGTSITSVLSKYETPITGCENFDQHDVLLTAWKFLKDDEFNDRFKFGFVRNPFDREVSNYFWHTKVNVQSVRDISFQDWVEWRYNVYDRVPLSWFPNKDDFYYNKGFAKNPQVGHFVNSYGDIISNFIGRYETLEDDWLTICKSIGIVPPRLSNYMPSVREKDYRVYYTDRLVDIVGNAHQLDLIAFNYDFEHGMLSDKISSSWRLNGKYDIALTSRYNYYYG